MMFATLFVFGALFSTQYAAKLPDYIKKCKLSDPYFDDCMKRTVEEVVQKLDQESPEMGIKSLEPLEITTLTIGHGTGPVNVQQNFKNIKLHGLTKSKVLNYKADFDKHVLYTESLSPELRLEAEYELNGRILLLPVQGKGLCNVTLVDAWLNHTLVYEPTPKKGKEYWKIRDYVVTIVPERMTFKFDNLFNGDKRLGDEINRVLNENWEAIFNDVRGGYDQSFGLIFKDIASRVFNRIPVESLFYK